MPHRFQTLQAFRALAALGVVLFHATTCFHERTGIASSTILIPGCSGVDFFFVLSGFIIFAAHAKDFNRPEAFREFLRRRYVRVYPIYFILTVVVIGLYSLHLGHYSKLNPTILVKSFLLMPQSPGSRPILNTGWTLSHEMLFYIVFATFIICTDRIRRILFALLTLGTMANCVHKFAGPYWLSSWLFSPYNFEFLLGCVAARTLRFNSGGLSLLGGLSVLAASWLYASTGSIALGDGNSLGMVALFGPPYFLIVLGAASIETRKKLSVPSWLTRIGDASYSIYLTNFLTASAAVAGILRAKIQQPPPFIIIESAVAATGVGYVVYLYLEKPLLARMKGTKAVGVKAHFAASVGADGLTS